MKQFNTHPFSHLPTDGAERLEARIGMRVAALLTQQSESADHAISERLRFAREQALSRARASAAQATGAPVLVGSSRGVGLLAAPSQWLFRLASVLPLIVLAVGLFAIDEWHDEAMIRAAAEVDTALLGDDLPPDAYSDPGFVEFLKTPRD